MSVETFGDISIRAGGTYTGAWSHDLSGCRGITCDIIRSGTTGGDPAVTAYVQTSFGDDDGVDCAAFYLSGNPVIFAVDGMSPTAAPIAGTDGTLTPGTILNGCVGTRFRLKLIVAGDLSETVIVAGRYVVR